MTVEEILDSENFWKDDFEIKFIRINKDGTEWWQVRNITLKKVVSCNSIIQAFRIAYLAEELLKNDSLKTKANRASINKAKDLLA